MCIAIISLHAACTSAAAPQSCTQVGYSAKVCDTSIAHEGSKEAFTIVSPQLAENLPCVGTMITAGNALQSYSNAAKGKYYEN